MAQSLAEEIAETHTSDLIEADQLLREIVQAGRQPNAGERVFLRGLAGTKNALAISFAA